MSYSFSVKAKDKHEAIAKIVDQMDKVVAQQPVHKRDRDDAINVARVFLDFLDVPEKGQVIRVNMGGSLGWKDIEQTQFTSANVSVSSYISADDN